MAKRCACGKLDIKDECDWRVVCGHRHGYNACWPKAIEDEDRDACVMRDAERLDNFNRNASGAAALVNDRDQAASEQKSYRAGWAAGARNAEAEIQKLGAQLQYTQEHNAKLFENLQHERAKNRKLHAQVYLDRAVPKGGVTIDLDRMRHEAAASADREATRAIVEREPWHDGIDPDDV